MKMLDYQLSEMEEQVRTFIVSAPNPSTTAVILRSAPGFGPVATLVLISEMPEMGRIGRRKIASLADLAPFARESGASEGKRSSVASGSRCATPRSRRPTRRPVAMRSSRCSRTGSMPQETH